MKKAILLSGVFFLMAGCSSSTPPLDTLSTAEVAINRALQAQASRYAPQELQLAAEKLNLAKAAVNDGRNEEGQRLAEEARVEARVAETRAQAAVAQHDARQTRQVIRPDRQ